MRVQQSFEHVAFDFSFFHGKKVGCVASYRARLVPYVSIGAGLFHVDTVNDDTSVDGYTGFTSHRRTIATENRFGLELRGGVTAVLARHLLIGTELNYFTVPSRLRSFGWGIEFKGGPHLIHRDDAGVFGKAGEAEWMAFFSDPSGNVLALATRKSL